MATPEERHPELFRPHKNESPRGKKREVPMEALALGFNRTGTATMSVALEKLGIHTYHSLLWFSTNLGDIPMWNEALENKFEDKGPKYTRNEWDQLLHSFGGVSSDTPAIAFAQDLIEAYPEAKVILVERDIDEWYKSFNSALIYQMFHPINNLVKHIDPWFTGPIGKCQQKTMRLWLGAHNADELRAVAKDAYRNHYALIRRITPKERLLEYKLSDGWEPLCKFLSKDVPRDTPFPHTNDADFMNERISIQMATRARMVAGYAALYGVPVAVAAWVGWRYYAGA